MAFEQVADPVLDGFGLRAMYVESRDLCCISSQMVSQALGKSIDLIQLRLLVGILGHACMPLVVDHSRSFAARRAKS